MDELYAMLKEKLQSMREEQKPVVGIDYNDLSKLYQFVCLMRQMKEIMEWVK